MRKELVSICGLLLGVACTEEPKPEPSGPVEVGEISYYADSLAGNKTASGVPYDPRAETCAHRKLPFGTRIEIVLVEGGSRASCVVNDRGPYAKDRILDVSRRVAEKLGMVQRGAAQAKLTPYAPAAKP